MKININSFICGMLVMGAISAIAVCADDVWQTINVLPNTIKVVVDGKEVQADNFLYNDTTYLPIRAVSEALGKDVQYDTETGTATISEKKEDDKVEVISKYTPAVEYINNTDYIVMENDTYYAKLNFVAHKIQEAGYQFDYDYGTETFFIKKDDEVIFSKSIINVEDMGVIPYDQFVEEIEPLLK
ncbi:MAG: stalk domain-containing protein [Hominilimicola sp.]